MPIVIGLGGAMVLLAVRGIIFRLVGNNARRSSTFLGDAIPGVLRTPSFYLCFALAFYMAIAFSDLPARYTQQLFQLVHVILILSITLGVANLSSILFKHLMQATDSTTRTSGLAQGMVKGAVTGIGILVILSVLGISVAPLLTALGVGGLAVALALKDTLENLFAGIYLISDKAIRVGDYVKLETGQEGSVSDIGWRTTKVGLSNDTMVILPNSKLAQSVVTNYSFPDQRLWTSVRIPVAGDSDPQKVEDLILGVAREGSEDVVGMVSPPAPVVRLSPGFGDNSLEFTLSFCVRQFSEQSFAQHEMRKRVLKRLREEHVAMPVRTGLQPAPALT